MNADTKFDTALRRKAGIALEYPVETILSGPAASVVGAGFLTGLTDFVVADMGGTTTDVAVVSGGRPVISGEGALVGAWRTMDHDQVIDASGTLPNGATFNGARELSQVVAKDPRYRPCLAGAVLTYALGRGLERFDRPVVDQITHDLAQNNYKFTALVTAIVDSRPFQMRSRDGGVQ